MHEVNVLDLIMPEPGSFTIMDRGFLDFARLSWLTQAGAFFVIRPKSNTLFKRVYSRTVDKTTGLRCDQTVRLTGVKSPDDYPQYLRYVVFYDEKTDKRRPGGTWSRRVLAPNRKSGARNCQALRR
jgi:hypothetical protein